MKNRWWLKLYTIPFLKHTALIWLIVGACFFFKLDFLAFFLLLVLGIPTRQKSSFTGNFAFHKHHMNLPELRRGIIEDFLIRTGTHLIFGVLVWAIMSFDDRDLELLLMIVGAGIFFETLSLIQLVLRQGAHNLKDVYQLGPSKYSSFWRIVAISLIIPLFLCMGVLGAVLEIGASYVISFIAGGFFICMIAFVLRVPFHLEPPAGSVLRFLKYSSVGMFGAMALYGMLVLMTAPVVESELDPVVRMEVLKFRGIFQGPLSVETTVKLYQHTNGDDSFIFAHWPKKMNDFPVEELIKKPGIYGLHKYITSTTPSPRNLIMVSQMLEKIPGESEDPLRRSIEKNLVAKWPKATPAPEAFAKYVRGDSERQPANKR